MKTGALIVLAGCASMPPPERTALPLDGEVPAPIFDQHPPMGELVRGRVVVIDLWATWCEPCVEAVPALIRLEKSYRPAGLVVAGVNVGEDLDTARAFTEQAGIPYAIYADPEFRFADRIGSRSLPTILVVDRSGNIVKRSDRLDKDVLLLIRDLLKAR